MAVLTVLDHSEVVPHDAQVVAVGVLGQTFQANGHGVFRLLAELAENGTTVVFITHDLNLAAAADRVVSMIDGRIESVAQRGATS